jgi:hypothetical protein
MKKALRRHQQRVAAIRRARYIWRECTWYWHGTFFAVLQDDPRFQPGWHAPEKPWQHSPRITMNGEPKWHQKLHNLRPSRVRSNRLLRDIERGVDPDLIRRWPDYRRPHIYYW